MRKNKQQSHGKAPSRQPVRRTDAAENPRVGRPRRPIGRPGGPGAARRVPAPVAQPQPAEAEKAPPTLEQQLAAALAERDDLLGRLQRVSADYLNYQKRVQKTIEEAHQFANAELLKSLIDVVDDLERAIEHAQANHPADDPLLVGTKLVFQKAMDLLKRHGVEPIEAQGAFDPAIHQALMQPAAQRRAADDDRHTSAARLHVEGPGPPPGDGLLLQRPRPRRIMPPPVRLRRKKDSSDAYVRIRLRGLRA